MHSMTLHAGMVFDALTLEEQVSTQPSMWATRCLCGRTERAVEASLRALSQTGAYLQCSNCRLHMQVGQNAYAGVTVDSQQETLTEYATPWTNRPPASPPMDWPQAPYSFHLASGASSSSDSDSPPARRCLWPEAKDSASSSDDWDVS